ncbi:MAG: heme o synthase [Archaeoglobaceae archaeon]|nr:heme o synthase [Archaeoglobaceae archaeon]MDW7989321.1 heme o synthase [Archaeoglobaceae archaeon]
MKFIPIIEALIEVIKPKQTFLLMLTFIITFIVAGGRNVIPAIAAFFTIAGTTALNMWLDRDIDALMMRTRNRPLPSGELSSKICAIYGILLFNFGFVLALLIRFEFALVLFMGLFFDIIVYTIMLKRKSPYSIVLGGFAGAMPALAGWVAVEGFTLPGFLIASIVLLWIPSHIWFIAIYYEEDYRKAGIPMFPVVFGVKKTLEIIIFSTLLIFIILLVLFLVLPMHQLYLLISIPAVLYFLFRALKFALSPEKSNARKMYKLASVKLGLIFLAILIARII